MANRLSRIGHTLSHRSPSHSQTACPAAAAGCALLGVCRARSADTYAGAHLSRTTADIEKSLVCRSSCSGTPVAAAHNFLLPTPHSLVETTSRWVDQAASSRKSQIRTARLSYVPNYTWAHRHHTGRSEGIAVLYHNSIACLTMAALNTQSAAPVSDPTSPSAVLLLTMRYPHCLPFLLGVGYLPSSYLTPAPKVDGVRGMCASLSQASTYQLPVVLVGDFNLHYSDWEETMRRGESTAAPVERQRVEHTQPIADAR